MTKRKGTSITLELDDTATRMLAELEDFHGECTSETLCLLIRYAHADMQRLVEEEFGENGEKIPPRRPQLDDEIPI